MKRLIFALFIVVLICLTANAESITPLGQHKYFDFIFTLVQDLNQFDQTAGGKYQARNTNMLKYSLWNLLNDRYDMLIEYGAGRDNGTDSINNSLGVGLKVLLASENSSSDLSAQNKKGSYGYGYDGSEDRYVQRIQDYGKLSSKSSWVPPVTLSGLVGFRSLTANFVNQGTVTGMQGYIGLKASKEITREKSFTPYVSVLYRNSNYSKTLSFGQIDFSLGLAASLFWGWGRVHSELTRQLITPTFENTYTIDQIAIAFESNF